MDDAKRPGSDADAAEIVRWMGEDFGRAVAEGMAYAGVDAIRLCPRTQ